LESVSTYILTAIFILARVSVRLLNREEALSVCIITFADDLSTSYIGVEDEDTPKVGRIILYRYKNGHLNMITEKELNGAPHAMLAFHGKLLVAVGSSVRIKILSFRFYFYEIKSLDSFI
jgi:hypothetical protein